MPLPITIPYTFATATTSIPLSQLDSDFSTVANAINGIGNGTNALSNVVITGGTIDNVAIGATTSTTGKFTTITATTGNITTINATTTNSATIRSDANLTFQSNGTTTAMTITTAQNVGIGKTPTLRFEVAGTGSGSTIASRTQNLGTATADNAYQYIQVGGSTNPNQISAVMLGRADSVTAGRVQYEHLSDAMALYTANSERMRIDSSGNVGIGTSSPAFKFVSVGGGIQLSGGTSAQEGVRIQRASGVSSFTGINNDNNAYNALSFATSASEAMRIGTSGLVSVARTGGFTGSETFTANGFGTFGSDTAPQVIIGNTGSGYGVLGTYSNYGMEFRTNNTARMYIDTSGNVGIGLSNPALRLDVLDSQNTNTGGQIKNANTGTSASVDWRVANDASYGGIRTFGSGHASAANQTWFFTAQANPLILATNFTERMRVDSSGYVTMSNQPGFMASIDANTDATVNANSLVPFNKVNSTNQFNTASGFNTGTSLFTAPVAGRYFFSFTLFITNSASSTQSMQGGIRVNGAFISGGQDAYAVCNATPNSVGGTISITTSVILSLAANDTVGVAARTNALRIYQGHCFFTGYLLG